MSNNNKARQIRLTGADTKSLDLLAKKQGYDMDAIAETETRTDSSKPFVAHIRSYNPNSTIKENRSVLPADLKIGSM